MINTGKLAGKTLFVTGASRGIGKAIALKAARDGANVAIAAKSVSEDPRLGGTIYTAAKEMEEAGGKGLALQVDIRDEEQVKNAINATADKFGGIDIVVNNASAISLTGTQATDMKRYDLMNQVNARGTFMVSKYAIDHLKKSSNPHILTLSPPLDLKPLWFQHHVAYSIAKYGMSLCALGMAAEFKETGIAVNTLWPRTAIWTAALKMLGGDDSSKSCRKVDIMADAAYAILTKSSKEFTGNFCIDEQVLRDDGISDFDQYAVAPGNKLTADFFLPDRYLTPDLDLSLYQRSEAAAGGDAPAEFSNPQQVFDNMSKRVNDDIKKELNAVMSFVIGGNNWYVDSVAARPLNVATGEGAEKPDVTFITDEETFIKMATGKVKAANAFMSGKLKVKGNLAIAMKAEKLFAKIRN